jgi:hypothetical protein
MAAGLGAGVAGPHRGKLVFLCEPHPCLRARRLKRVPIVSRFAIIGTVEIMPGHREQVLRLPMAHKDVA